MYTVRAIPAPGSNSRYRAGRRWTEAPVDIEIVEQSETVEVIEHGRKTRQPHPTRLTMVELAVLQTDNRLAVVPTGGAVPDVRGIAEIEIKLAEAQAALAQAAEDRAEDQRRAESAAAAATARIADLEAQLAARTRR